MNFVGQAMRFILFYFIFAPEPFLVYPLLPFQWLSCLHFLLLVVRRKGGSADKMPCNITNLTQPVCLTIVYNLSNGLLVNSYVSCGECKLETTLNPLNKNLTIKVPIILEGEVTFTDNFHSGCVTTGIRLP
ncbi:hypothetical protein [Ectobacillus funiculus]|uniref:Uncharacterized protein n=1 Tax=Ectobacillus funiculus TaxID=137993 RepID=A0ABV5WG48_9BACI